MARTDVIDDAEILGYCDRLEYRAGDEVSLFAHSTVGDLSVDLVRLRTFDARVGSDLPAEVPVDGFRSVTVPAGPQSTWRGSFGIAHLGAAMSGTTSLELACWVWIAAAAPSGLQCLLTAVRDDGEAVSGVALHDGLIGVQVGGRAIVSSNALPARVWCRLVMVADPSGVAVTIEPAGRPALTQQWAEPMAREWLSTVDAVVVGAGAVTRSDGLAAAPRDCFTGKLDGVAVLAGRDGARELVAEWDGRCDVGSMTVADSSGWGRALTLINGPTRAVTGRRYDGSEVDFRRVSEQYSAVHFHRDDLDDARWSRSAVLTLPADLPSGIYALRLAGAQVIDRVPLMVTGSPLPGDRPAIAVLIPTWTYLAYANDKVYEEVQNFADLGWTDRDCVFDAHDQQLERHPELAGSVYDTLADGSGQVWSTARRPILNMRPDYADPIQQGPRHFSADLYLTTWLERRRRDYDVLTDNDLHRDGRDALAGYQVVITGTHPEYVSGRMLDALNGFVDDGGRLMYLGGNFGAWVTTQPSDRPDLIQVRRGYASSRTWSSAPGEVHHDTTGELGGLWRNRGRSPARLVGVYTAAQGWDLKAPGYRRTTASHDPSVSWIFDGIAGLEGDIFGTDGLAMGGAASDEIDSYLLDEGSPADAVVLATSERHSKYYKPILCRVMFVTDGLNGDVNPEVRSDIVLFERGSGGAVFSVGSIGWAAAMAHGCYANPVASLTGRVLDRFLSAGPVIGRRVVTDPAADGRPR